MKPAQEAGFAESDPSLDVNDTDAVNKLSILLTHAYGIVSNPKEIVHTGIQNLLYHQAPGELSTDFYLRVYLCFKGVADGPHHFLDRVAEWTRSGKRTTLKGTVHCSKLLDISWWQNENTSLILYPNAILETLPEPEEETFSLSASAFA